MVSVGWKWPASRQSRICVGHRVAQVELVRADHVAFRADAKQLAFDRVEIVARGSIFSAKTASSDSRSKLARCVAVGGHVLEAVRDPDVGDAAAAQLPAELLADLAAGDAVLDPELADAVGRSWPA